MVDLLGSTCLMGQVDPRTIEGPPDMKEMMHMIKNSGNDPEDAHYLNSCHVFCMRPILQRVAGFLGVSAELTGTMGKSYVHQNSLEY